MTKNSNVLFFPLPSDQKKIQFFNYPLKSLCFIFTDQNAKVLLCLAMTMPYALRYLTFFVVFLLNCFYFFRSVVKFSLCCVSNQSISYSKCANSPDFNFESDQGDQACIKCP